MTRAPRPATTLALLVAAVALLLGFGAPPASAHAFLIATSPPAGYTLTSPPTQISLTFSETVTAGADAIRARTTDGLPVELGPARQDATGRQVSAVPSSRLRTGGYVVSWRVLSDDGDPIAGTFTFAVGTGHGSALATGGSSAATPGDTAIALLRGLLFLAIALGLGTPVMQALLRPDQADEGPRPPVHAAAWLGILATLGLIAYTASEGNPCRGLSDTGLTQLISSTPGRVLLAELGAFGLTLALSRHTPPLVAAAPLLVVLVAEGIRAHPADAAGAVGALVLAVHLTVAAIWVGGLVQTLRISSDAWRAGARREAWRVADRYARIAALLFALVVLTGTVQTLMLVPHRADLTDTGYGQVLMTKLVLVLLITVLALAGRRRLRRVPSDGPFGHRTRLEAGALIAVLLATGVLVTQAPPRRSNAIALPPAPLGPVLWQGLLLGNITVGVGASDGQLRIDAATPGQPGAGKSTPEITTRLTGPRGGRLSLRACGPGCFTTPISWARGVTTLSVTAKAEGWAGGIGSVRIGWPLRTEPQRLDALRRSVQGVKRLAFTTIVSSGPGGHVTPHEIAVTGRRFLASEPWGTAPIPDVISVPRADGQDLYFALPNERVYIQLTLDRRGHLIAEHFVSHNHDIYNTFRAYP